MGYLIKIMYLFSKFLISLLLEYDVSPSVICKSCMAGGLFAAVADIVELDIGNWVSLEELDRFLFSFLVLHN